jgi:hypothetical protein
VELAALKVVHFTEWWSRRPSRRGGSARRSPWGRAYVDECLREDLVRFARPGRPTGIACTWGDAPSRALGVYGRLRRPCGGDSSSERWRMLRSTCAALAEASPPGWCTTRTTWRMPPQRHGPTEARPSAMTASVCAPHRWHSISATAGISVLPLALMYPLRGCTCPGWATWRRRNPLSQDQPCANFAPRGQADVTRRHLERAPVVQSQGLAPPAGYQEKVSQGRRRECQRQNSA